MKHFFKFDIKEFVFKKFLFSGVCLIRSLSFRSLSFQEFVFPEFVFQEFVFQEFVMAPVQTQTSQQISELRSMILQTSCVNQAVTAILPNPSVDDRQSIDTYWLIMKDRMWSKGDL